MRDHADHAACSRCALQTLEDMAKRISQTKGIELILKRASGGLLQAEVELMVALISATLGKFAPEGERLVKLRESLLDANTHTLVLHNRDNRVFALAAFTLNANEGGSEMGYLLELHVDQLIQSCGVGSAFMAEAKVMVAQAGLKSIRLTVDDGNAYAFKWYQDKHKFIQVHHNQTAKEIIMDADVEVAAAAAGTVTVSGTAATACSNHRLQQPPPDTTTACRNHCLPACHVILSPIAHTVNGVAPAPIAPIVAGGGRVA